MYPLFLDLTGRLAVVVGAGPVGRRKVAGLLAAGARVRVVCLEEGSVEGEWLREPANLAQVTGSVRAMAIEGISLLHEQAVLDCRVAQQLARGREREQVAVEGGHQIVGVLLEQPLELGQQRAVVVSEVQECEALSCIGIDFHHGQNQFEARILTPRDRGPESLADSGRLPPPGRERAGATSAAPAQGVQARNPNPSCDGLDAPWETFEP